MKLILAASLALTPALSHAQSPAQNLVAMNHAPAAAARPAGDAPRRVSTGVVAPKLLKSVSVDTTRAATLNAPRHLTIELTVTRNGTPADIKVITPVDATFASSVAASVAQFRYEPGTLDGTAADVPLTLDLTVLPYGSR